MPNTENKVNGEPITETYTDLKHVIDGAYTVTYLPCYRDMLIRDTMKDVASHEYPQEVQDAVRAHLKQVFTESPMEYLDSDKLFDVAVEYQAGYYDCMLRHAIR